MKNFSPLSRGGGRGGKGSQGVREPLAVRLKRRILQRHFVQLHMALILGATTAAGLVASKALLEAGVEGLLVRYPLAVAISYAAFLGMAWMWVRYAVGMGRRTGGFAEDAADGAGEVAEDVADALVDVGARGVSRRRVSGSWGGGSWDLNIDSDEGMWILLALAVVVLVVCGAGAYLIWAAPEILPEIAVSALLASGLRRRAQEAEAGGWVKGLVASTALPFGVVLVAVCGLAYAVERTCPGAVKLMEALRCAPRVH